MQKSRWAPKAEEAEAPKETIAAPEPAPTAPAAQPEPAPVQASRTAPVCFSPFIQSKN
jgi:hypothetical protein